MQYIEKNDNIERVYNVFFNEEELSRILDEIVKNVNYEEEGTFTLSYNACVDYSNNHILSGEDLPNKMPRFKNIKRIYRCTSNTIHSYHNDSVACEGTQVFVPYLAYIIKGILRKETNCMESFINYKNSEEIVPLDDKIKILNDKINSMNNEYTDMKISLLKDLRRLLDNKKNNKYFDTELLNKYYNEASGYIELELVSEKVIIKERNKVLLKDLK